MEGLRKTFPENVGEAGGDPLLQPCPHVATMDEAITSPPTLDVPLHTERLARLAPGYSCRGFLHLDDFPVHRGLHQKCSFAKGHG